MQCMHGPQTVLTLPILLLLTMLFTLLLKEGLATTAFTDVYHRDVSAARLGISRREPGIPSSPLIHCNQHLHNAQCVTPSISDLSVLQRSPVLHSNSAPTQYDDWKAEHLAHQTAISLFTVHQALPCGVCRDGSQKVGRVQHQSHPQGGGLSRRGGGALTICEPHAAVRCPRNGQSHVWVAQSRHHPSNLPGDPRITPCLCHTAHGVGHHKPALSPRSDRTGLRQAFVLPCSLCMLLPADGLISCRRWTHRALFPACSWRGQRSHMVRGNCFTSAAAIISLMPWNPCMRMTHLFMTNHRMS